ncbi:hypothetical protein MODO_2522 [Myroides odoratimimus]|uniref:hypothetical protein n=1 Tax=Myroides odoratimimus TaxID=76832 RepID=UPI0007247588|nr:hypothetical protein [Myroides odoratimimus]GAQ14830.1 hypothetical protein MODO_2522 [Myroides odoratimimus]STZ48887.1 Uncharacterised protein [Myroides odoratimimus]
MYKIKIDKILKEIHKEELEEFIVYYSERNPQFKLDLETYFSDKFKNDDIQNRYRALFKSIISSYNYKGFIDYNNTPRLASELQEHLETLEVLIQRHRYKESLDIIKAALTEVIKVVEYCDDSSGHIGVLLSEILQYLDKLIESQEIGELKLDLMEFLESQINREIYFDYGDYGYDLLDSYKMLCFKTENKERFLTYIDKKASKEKDNRFLLEHLIKLKLDFFEHYKDIDSFLATIMNNLELSDVRIRLANYYKDNKEFDKAKEQVYIGIKQAKELDYLGLVFRWECLLLEIYELSGDIEKMRCLYKKFALEGKGDKSEYLIKWKNTYTDSNWSIVLKDYINEVIKDVDKFCKKNTYMTTSAYNRMLLERLGKVYVLENMIQDLFNLVSQVKDLGLVLSYIDVLQKHYDDFVLVDLLMPLVLLQAKGLNNRSGYRSLAYIIKEIQDRFINQSVKIETTIKALQELYPRRTAMIDELNKLRSM